MRVGTVTMQVYAPFSGVVSYVQVNGNPTADVTLVTRGCGVTGSERPTRDAVNAIFGEEMPRTTRDERDPEAPEERFDRDEWLRANVPPHHG